MKPKLSLIPVLMRLPMENTEIAADLQRTPKSVEKSVQELIDHYGAANRTEVCLAALHAKHVDLCDFYFSEK
jgi:DNA-binding NarL/FixJ family response regulator